MATLKKKLKRRSFINPKYVRNGSGIHLYINGKQVARDVFWKSNPLVEKIPTVEDTITMLKEWRKKKDKYCPITGMPLF